MSFVCNICLLRWESCTKYLRHLKFHSILTENKYIRCNYDGCSITFGNEETFKFHLQQKHDIPEIFSETKNHYDLMYDDNGQLICSIERCKVEFLNPKHLVSHLNDHIKKGQRVKCPISKCNSYYKNVKSMKNHRLAVHSIRNTNNDPWAFDRKDMIDESEIEHYEKLYKENLGNFYTKYETKYRLPKKVVNMLVKDLECLRFQEREISMSKLNRAFRQAQVSQTNIDPLLDIISDSVIFFDTNKYFDTTHKRSVINSQKTTLVNPQKVKLHELKDGTQTHFHYVPILETIKAIYENNYLTFDQSEQDNEKNGTLVDYRSAEVFKMNSFFEHNKHGIELIFYQDAFEIVNPIGSSRTKFKILAIYMVIGNMPHYLRTHVDNIYLVALVRDKWLDFDKMFNLIQKDLKTLEDVGVDLPAEENVKGGLVMMFGDNLGHHGVAGMQESFGKNIDYFCRFCEVHAKYFTRNFDANDFPRYFNLRTPQSNRNNLSILEKTKKNNQKITNVKGIKQHPILENLKSFHVFEPGLPPCLGHDLLEGVVAYDLALYLKDLHDKKWFTWDELNASIKNFKFSSADSKNRPQPRFGRKVDKIIGNAWELRTLIRFLPIILKSIGKIKDPYYETWQAILMLSEITDIICAHEIHENNLPYLEFLCEGYIVLRVELFPDVNLRPKHHYLCHYALLIKKFGPLIKSSTLRCESKHCFYKNSIRQSRNFRDVTKSLSVRHELYQLLLRYGLNAYVQAEAVGIRSLKRGQNVDLELCLRSKTFINSLYECTQVTCKGFVYDLGKVIITGSPHYHQELSGGTICKILLDKDVSDIYFIIEVNSFEFDAHSHTYEITHYTPKIFQCVGLQDICHQPLNIYSINNIKLIRLKHEIVNKLISL